MSPAEQEHDPVDSVVHLWGAHLRLQATRVQDTVMDRARSAELLDALFFDLLDVLRPDLFVEAGAFEATTSMRVKAGLPGARVVAFEANPDTHRRFSAQHDYAGQGVDYRCLALAEAAGPVTFHREDDDDPLRAGSSSLLERNRSGEVWVPETATSEAVVDGLPLDEALGELRGRAALWMDVEGAARQVLSGAPRFIDACHLVKIEMEDAPFWAGQMRSHDVLDMLLRRGFIPLARDAEYPQQFNVLLGRADLAQDASTVRAVESYFRAMTLPPSQGSTAPPARLRARLLGWLERRALG